MRTKNLFIGWLLVGILGMVLGGSTDMSSLPTVESNADSGSLIIAPWTPPEVKESAVSCWGRTYDYTGSVLPVRVISQGEDILAGPIQLVAVVEGHEVTLSPASFNKLGANGEAVHFVTSSTSDAFSIVGHQTTEFDGMTRVDLTLTPVKVLQIERLELVVPLKPKYAELFHHSNIFPQGVWDWPRKQMNAGAVGSEGLTLPFVYWLWLGNDDRGIQLFSETDEPWMPADPSKAVMITPGDTATILRMNLLNNTTLGQPWKWTFGFMATPVKPWPRDYYNLRYCHEGGYGMEHLQGPGSLEHLAEEGVNYLGIHESWSDEQSLPRPKDPTQFTSLLAACHAKGIHLVPYSGCYMSSRSPEYRSEWNLQPMESIYSYLRPDNQDRCFVMCNNTGYPDLLVRCYKQAFEEYGFSSLYLDGITTPYPCMNQVHGCSYVGKDGEVHPTTPIWRTRELMKNLYRLVKGAPEPGIIVAHTSGSILLPVLSFADFYLEGEHLILQHALIHMGTPEYPEAIIRAEMCGHNFGIPATYLPEYRDGVINERGRTLCALYDIRWMWHSQHQVEIWRGYDVFDMGDTEWVPFWKTQNLVTMDGGGDIRCSAYLTPARGALFVVANLDCKDATTTLTFNPEGLKVNNGKPLRITEISGTMRLLENVDGGFSMKIPGNRFLMIAVEPASDADNSRNQVDE